MSRCIPFRECLACLDAYCEGELLGDLAPDTMLAMLKRGERPGHYAEALHMLIEWIPVRDADQCVRRNELVHALGPLRLRHQAGDGDADSYRALARLIRAIDAAYDALDSDTAHGHAGH
jgi:hypothetical protein